MKHHLHILSAIITITLIITACGPDEEEQKQREEARQDSLEQVRRDSLQQQRQDSLAKVRNKNEETTSARSNIAFSDDGRLAIQVESWRSRHKAQSRVEVWKERGYAEASVVQHGSEATGEVWFRVRIGRVDSREDARELQQTLEEEYQASSWIETL